MENNTQLLQDIYKSTQLGEESLKALIKNVTDPNLRNDLQRQMSGYYDIHLKAKSEILKSGGSPKENDGLKKLAANMGVKVNTLTNKTTSHLAEMAIEGSTMGIVDITKTLNLHSNPSAVTEKLANDMLKFEQKNIEHLKSYL